METVIHNSNKHVKDIAYQSKALSIYWSTVNSARITYTYLSTRYCYLIVCKIVTSTTETDHRVIKSHTLKPPQYNIVVTWRVKVCLSADNQTL